MIKLIVAVDRGNAIGWSDGRLPWLIPGDLNRFKELTSGHTILMGRRTFESLNLPDGLPNRENVVLTRNPAANTAGSPVHFFNIGENPLATYIEIHKKHLKNDLWIIGGAEIYQQAIEQELIDEIYVTLVNVDSEADVLLPFNLSAWKLFVLHQAKIGVQWVLTYHSDPQRTADGLTYTFLTLQKCQMNKPEKDTATSEQPH